MQIAIAFPMARSNAPALIAEGHKERHFATAAPISRGNYQNAIGNAFGDDILCGLSARGMTLDQDVLGFECSGTLLIEARFPGRQGGEGQQAGRRGQSLLRQLAKRRQREMPGPVHVVRLAHVTCLKSGSVPLRGVLLPGLVAASDPSLQIPIGGGICGKIIVCPLQRSCY